jgi:hypothetical protein
MSIPARGSDRRCRGGRSALFCGLALAGAAVPSPAANEDAGAAEAARERAVTLERFVVSASRIELNPWRYAAVPGFEVLSRASDEETAWELDALRRGLWIQDAVMPKDWMPAPALPYTVIIDDTDLNRVPAGQVHSQPVVFHAPDDALTWGPLSDRIDVSMDPMGAYDGDTFAVNTNLHGVDTTRITYGSISLERLFRCAPPLPRWLMEGLLGQNCGLFRESFALFPEDQSGIPALASPWIRRADGPGTLWESLGETQQLLDRLKKKKKMKIPVPPLGALFAERPPPGDKQALWESEAGLFARWALMGPGQKDPASARAFRAFVDRARRGPVTEQMFIDCFGFGYAAMEEKLGAYLKTVLALPTSVSLEMPRNFKAPELRAATADEIGRILGDWMRMQAGALRADNAGLSREYLDSAGRMLERAYRRDNGLPPDADPSRPGGGAGGAGPNTALGAPVVMPPFVVSASRVRDPALLAVYGLYEHDLGNDGRAREFLEAAAKAGAVRPRAYLVLARLRFSEALGVPAGAEARISAHQAEWILEPLAVARRSSESADIDRLVVETWIQCEARPTPDEVAQVEEGAGRFPRDTGLTYRSAYLCAKSGYPAQAAAMIERGLGLATEGESRRYLEELRSGLAAPRSK